METTREQGKIHKRVICNLGRLEELQEGGQLERLALALSRYTKLQLVKEQARIEPGPDKEWGPTLNFRALWEELGLSSVIDLLAGRTAAIEFNTEPPSSPWS